MLWKMISGRWNYHVVPDLDTGKICRCQSISVSMSTVASVRWFAVPSLDSQMDSREIGYSAYHRLDHTGTRAGHAVTAVSSHPRRDCQSQFVHHHLVTEAPSHRRCRSNPRVSRRPSTRAGLPMASHTDHTFSGKKCFSLLRVTIFRYVTPCSLAYG